MKHPYTIVCSVILLLLACPIQAQTDSLKKSVWSGEMDLFGYQTEEKKWIKIDLLNLLNSFNQNGITGLLAVGYEQKIGTVWSVNGEVATAYSFDFRSGATDWFRMGENGILVALSPRYYYNLRRRMAAERSADNLSANYLTISIGTRLMKTEPGWTAPDNVRYLYTDNISFAPMLGMQRRIFKDGFVDISIGFKMAYGEPQRSPVIFPRGTDRFWQLYPFSSLRAGLAF